MGPLGRNAEGSGSLNSSGKLAAMYSYSKTKGLFGGVSIEGSVIVSRPDANRLAYGGEPTVKQILSGAFDPPSWADVLVAEIQKATGRPTSSERWLEDEEGEGGGMGSESPQRQRAVSGSYVFGEGLGGNGNAAPAGRNRARSLLGPGESPVKERPTTRLETGTRRMSNLNPFSFPSDGPPSRHPPRSSESYNAGLSWDSSGPMNVYGVRSRSGSNAPRPSVGNTNGGEATTPDPDAHDKSLEDDEMYGFSGATSKSKRLSGTKSQIEESDDVLAGPSPKSTAFSRMSSSLVKGNGGRSRSNSRPQPFQDIVEDEGGRYAAPSSFSDARSPNKIGRDRINGEGRERNGGSSASNGGMNGHTSFTDDSDPFDRAHHQRASGGPKPNIPLKAGLEPAADGYARAVAQFDFNATDSGDLGLKAGQVVVVLDKVGNGDWWRGRRIDGKEGIFPSNYLEVLNIPKMLKGGLGREELRARMGQSSMD